MPLTPYQAELARLLSTQRSEDSYLAGGAALHIEPNTRRYSNDLDYFHAAGKDPGYTPLSLLDMLGRRGAYRPEDFERLHLAAPVDLPALKAHWTRALASAAEFVRSRPPAEFGCLYWSPREAKFVAPEPDDVGVLPHHGRPGGVLPLVVEP